MASAKLGVVSSPDPTLLRGVAEHEGRAANCMTGGGFGTAREDDASGLPMNPPSQLCSHPYNFWCFYCSAEWALDKTTLFVCTFQPLEGKRFSGGPV